MSTEKKEPGSVLDSARPNARYNKVLLIDSNETDLYVSTFALKSNFFANVIATETKLDRAIDYLKNVSLLSDVPDIIILDMYMDSPESFRFLNEFDQLSDFVKNKCKIIIYTITPKKEFKQRTMLYPFVVRYCTKPLDAYDLRDFEPKKAVSN